MQTEPKCRESYAQGWRVCEYVKDAELRKRCARAFDRGCGVGFCVGVALGGIAVAILQRAAS